MSLKYAASDLQGFVFPPQIEPAPSRPYAAILDGFLPLCLCQISATFEYGKQDFTTRISESELNAFRREYCSIHKLVQERKGRKEARK